MYRITNYKRPTLREHKIFQVPYNLADLLILFFYSHTPQFWHCLLLHPLNPTHSALMPITLQGETSNTLPYRDRSEHETGFNFVG
jgi:hypothetical protein